MTSQTHAALPIVSSAPLTGAVAPAEDGCGCGCSHDEASGSVDASVVAAGAGDLDVRQLPHGARHEIIFAKLAELEVGHSLVIVNDHDPKPLRYQTEALWPGRYVWFYLQAGPQEWRVAIRRDG
jgi:uncharacterized protein (DUF2249 family)